MFVWGEPEEVRTVSRVWKCDACGALAEDMVRGRWFKVWAYTGEMKEMSFHFLLKGDDDPVHQAFTFCSPACLAAFGNIQTVENHE